MQLKFSFSLTLSEQEQAPPSRPHLQVIETTGQTVETTVRPLAKCGRVVSIEMWRKRRTGR